MRRWLHSTTARPARGPSPPARSNRSSKRSPPPLFAASAPDSTASNSTPPTATCSASSSTPSATSAPTATAVPSRIIFEIVALVRERCGRDFHLAVRLSPERFGVATADIVEVFGQLVGTGEVDLIDLSLWDVFKEAIDPDVAGQPLLGLFTRIDRGTVRLAAAGKLYSGADVRRAIEEGVDVVALGRAAITNHDFPTRLRDDDDFAMRALPVSTHDLHREEVSDRFIDYLRGWKDFVAD